jgi:valyl-tRNA synthetase
MQWFVKIQPLADRAIEVVEQGEVKFVPENYSKTYFEWMRNIHDWCISRQLWWGHRIPAWYCKDCAEIIVARETPAKCSKCGSTKLEQDTDVLDTWFSSGLLPCSGLGWPDQTPDLDAFYPTSLLVTGFDILFFWVARMIMLNCHFMRGHKQGDVPFKTVYIHALVRDADRQKMSKTKGNVVDPIEIIEKYGTDAVRFTLASMAAPGTDIAFSEDQTDGYRAFANKIWNASRLLFMNVDRAQEAGVWALCEFKAPVANFAGRGIAGLSTATLEDRWILSRFNRVVAEVHDALETYRFHEAAHVVYHFFWGEYCDWYLELIKPRLAASDREQARAAHDNLISIFEAALRLLSPFMPFITEEIWHAVYDGKPPVKSIALTAYPQSDLAQVDAAAETEMAILQDLIVAIRNIRAELKIEPKQKLAIEVHAEDEIRGLIDRDRPALERMANVEKVTFVPQSLANAAGARSTARFDVRVIYEQKIDVAAERERLNKELTKMSGEVDRAGAQLSNEAFLSKAPEKVVNGPRQRKGELEVLIAKAKAALSELE